MSHASDYAAALPEVPVAIRDRYIPYRATFIEENLRALAAEHPGLLDAIVRTIDFLKAEPEVENISVDYDEEDVLYPVTIWARTTIPLGERWDRILALDDATDRILKDFPDLVLAAIL